jgi:hypothetical protein
MHPSVKVLMRRSGLLLAALALLSPASARQWNPDARGSALDYTQVLHAKPGGEIVVVWWVVPEAFPSDATTQVLKDVLGRYVVIGVANGRPTPNGGMGFSPILDLKISGPERASALSLGRRASRRPNWRRPWERFRVLRARVWARSGRECGFSPTTAAPSTAACREN